MREIPFGKPIIGPQERAAVADVLSGPILTHGPKVREFESAFASFTKAEHAVATSSCTAAMHLAYLYLGIGPGDEVLVPAQTHVATAHAVQYCGAKPVFVDSESRTGNVDIDLLESLITESTRAIAVVHYLGMPVDMKRVLAIARAHDLFVLEDCALALGTTLEGSHSGTLGDVGCFSFYPVKHITTAEGGMLISRRTALAEAAAKLRAFGIDRNVPSERRLPGMYEVEGLGFNYRLNEIGAALGLEQLRRVPQFLKKRRENYACLTAGLRRVEEVGLLASSYEGMQSSCYCQSAILRSPLDRCRAEIMTELARQGVGSSIYYPHPVPEMPFYAAKYGFGPDTCPVATRLSNASIALPVGPHLEVDDMEYIVDALQDVLVRVKHHA